MYFTRSATILLAMMASAAIMVTASTLPASQLSAHPVSLVRRTLPQKAVELAGKVTKAVVAGAAFNVIKEKCSEMAGYKDQAVKEQAAEVVKAIQDCESKNK
ncbi:hypothetical protein IWQ60_010126 [Tieghemiomyces parasiticus]|uniref:Uncharacterized protein n=1 Tax=Tieghemiomyces parasiticus TaxID=78921 RepID=A0A9W7ZSD2_9FUNG|nr:hypothetical protein IWQ60_010126 [Tieghemiomyces parasiticus]